MLTALVVAIVTLMVEVNWLLFMFNTQEFQGSNSAVRPDNSFIVYLSPSWDTVAKIVSTKFLIFSHTADRKRSTHTFILLYVCMCVYA
jgi:hypothetical protein